MCAGCGLAAIVWARARWIKEGVDGAFWAGEQSRASLDCLGTLFVEERALALRVSTDGRRCVSLPRLSMAKILGAAALLLGVVYAQESSLPVVDLGYELYRASDFNVS